MPTTRLTGLPALERYVLDIEDGGSRLGQTVRVVVEKAYRTYARARLVDS